VGYITGGIMLAVITMARRDSTRLKDKNIKLLNDKPMIQYTFDIIKKLPYQCYTITNDPKVKKLSEKNNISVIDEPEDLAANDYDKKELMDWVVNQINADYFVLLAPTSPIRIISEVMWMIDACIKSNTLTAHTIKKKAIYYIDSGYFFFFHRDMRHHIKDGNGLIFLDKIGIDIDTIDDFRQAEQKLL